jgi:hypothetical protein
MRDHGSVTPPSEPHGVPQSLNISGEGSRDIRTSPILGVTHAPTTRTVLCTVPRFFSGPGELDQFHSERARQLEERFGEVECRLTDITQDIGIAGLPVSHDIEFEESGHACQLHESKYKGESDRRHLTNEFAQAQVSLSPVGIPAASIPEIPETGPSDRILPPSAVGVPEHLESDIASIRGIKSATRHEDNIRDVVHSEREEMERRFELERQEARTVRKVLEQKLLAERARADEYHDRFWELKEELARLHAELEIQKQLPASCDAMMPRGMPNAIDHTASGRNLREDAGGARGGWSESVVG